MKKYCPKCKKSKNTDKFCISPSRSGGLSSYCKLCNNEHVKTYHKTKEGKKSSRRQYIKHINKKTAKNTANYAEKIGKLVKKPCVVCNSPKSEKHHEDYTKPLEVIWLCRTHHFELHRKKRQQPKLF